MKMVFTAATVSRHAAVVPTGVNTVNRQGAYILKGKKKKMMMMVVHSRLNKPLQHRRYI